MKKAIVIASVLGLAMMSAFQVQADDNRQARVCKTSTLKGLYVFQTRSNDSSYVDSGNEVFDGRGNVVGHVVDNGDETIHNLVGTYVINPDCSGVITYTQPEPAEEHIFLGPNGDSFAYIDHGVVPGSANYGTETRQGN